MDQQLPGSLQGRGAAPSEPRGDGVSLPPGLSLLPPPPPQTDSLGSPDDPELSSPSQSAAVQPGEGPGHHEVRGGQVQTLQEDQIQSDGRGNINLNSNNVLLNFYLVRYDRGKRVRI